MPIRWLGREEFEAIYPLPDSYRRLQAAQRVVTEEERREREKAQARESEQLRIRRKFSKVY